MYLQRLTIQGFKSFAQKTSLEFLLPQNGKKGLTAVVGPNGSGKSNIADAIRWVLGEQSIKNLRGKKGEDVIFAGSDKKARLGVAEVTLLLNNEDKEAPIEFSEVEITRRLYRDGDSEYLINGHQARLQDIVLLLARARFGQKNYLVIGQGMADAILRATPTERKDYFDEAAGIKEFQIKRQVAWNKLEATKENITQAEGLVREIEPRLRSLERQVKRLAQRDEVEAELRGMQKQYYGDLWRSLAERLSEFNKQYARIDEDLQKKKVEEKEILGRFQNLEQAQVVTQTFLELQKKYETTLHERQALEQKKFRLQSQLELARVRADSQKTFIPLPLPDIIKELDELVAGLNLLSTDLSSIKDIALLKARFNPLKEKTASLLIRLKNPEVKKAAYTQDPVVLKELEEIEKTLVTCAASLVSINQEIQNLNKEEEKKKGEFFDLQRSLQNKQGEVHSLEQHLHNVSIELARLETRKEGLEEEISIEMGPLAAEVKMSEKTEPKSQEELQPQIYRLKHQLELIGGIDPLAVAEYEETKPRFEFLETQIIDLNKALEDLIKTILEMDEVMKEKRTEAMKKINEEFNRFFQILFNGGSAKLVPLYEEEKKTEDVPGGEGGEEVINQTAERLPEEKREPIMWGVDIQATPPGKRIKDISILSGGEKALTSVALICAILSYSPSPFVVLDEVDAALDEANSVRYAEILERLSERTQFIVVTHNRASMTKSHILYGVTMGDDGISRLLSVKLEDAEKFAK